MSRLCHPRALGLLSGLLLAALVAGCGGSSSTDPSDGTHAFEATEATAAPKGKESGPTEAILEPVGEEGPKGKASYQIRSDGTPVLHIRAEGLEPVSEPSRYMVWIVGNRHDMVSLAAIPVGRDGRLSRRLETPESYLFVEDGSKTELLIAKAEDPKKVTAGISRSNDPWDPPVIGKPVLSGTFEGSFVGSAADG